MADYVLYRNEVLSRPKKRFYRPLGIFLVILSGIGIGELGYQLLIAPRLFVESIVIEGVSEGFRQDILEITQLDGSILYEDVDPQTIKKNLEEVPWIRSAEVDKVFPNKVVLTVDVRDPVGLVLVEANSTLHILALDTEMNLFLPARGKVDFSFPVFTGLRAEGPIETIRLSAPLNHLIRNVLNIGKDEPAILRLFSEFRLLSLGRDTFELVAYPIHYQVPVRMGSRITVETFKSALMVLDVMQREGILDEVEEIDFRTGNILYRVRGGGFANR